MGGPFGWTRVRRYHSFGVYDPTSHGTAQAPGETDVNAPDRHATIPEIRISGPARDAGLLLGETWADALRADAETRQAGAPWWRDTAYAKLVERYAPHLPDLYLGMARGAGLDEETVTTEEPDEDGCTSFAVLSEATASGAHIVGQTKDVRTSRYADFQVLVLELTDSPHSALTLTYPGWLFGHGFVTGGCTLLRNSLHLDRPERGMPFTAWGVLALHCPSVEDVMRMVYDHGVDRAFHVGVADERGGCVGIEHGRQGTAFVDPVDGIFVHANAVVNDPTLREAEREHVLFSREDSETRVRVLRERLLPDLGRLTPQLCHAALVDHTGYPASLCRHQSDDATTCALYVAEPAKRVMYAGYGPTCEHWLAAYELGGG